MSMEGIMRVRGVVREVNRGSKFKVELCHDDGRPMGHEITATLSGKIRLNFIKIVKGDNVQIEMSAYDLNNGRIIWRYK